MTASTSSIPSAAATADIATTSAPRNVSVPEALQLAAQQFQAGNRGEVEAICLKVLEVEPENSDALHLMGVLAHLAGKQAIALALIEKAIRINPRNAQYHYNLGVVLGLLRRTPEALAAYRVAVTLDPNQPNAMGNLGNCALELDYFDEALRAYDAILARDPRELNVATARAIALYAMRRFDDAGPAFDYAVSLAPEGARQRWERAHHLLMLGHLGPGWDDYDYRFGAPGSNVWHYPYAFPRWHGEPLAGKTLLLHGEQGLGDEIMFASIYAELIAEAKQTIICCQPHMAALFRDSFPSARIIEQLRADGDAWTHRPADWLNGVHVNGVNVNDVHANGVHGAPAHPAPTIDYQIPFGSLGAVRRRALSDFPRHTGYLRADATRVATWAEHLAKLPGMRVGLCWAANPAIADPVASRRSRKKSLTLRHLESLLSTPAVSFVSLQTWEAAQQVAQAAPWIRERIFDASAGLKDFADTAALIMNLDLVITVDTSVAHLAGALGKPVWVLLPWQADWRWHAEGSTSEWYPSAVLFRQNALNEWDGVINTVRHALETQPIPATVARASAGMAQHVIARAGATQPGFTRYAAPDATAESSNPQQNQATPGADESEPPANGAPA